MKTDPDKVAVTAHPDEWARSFYRGALRDGACRLGFVSVGAEDTAEPWFFPFNWPGGERPGCRMLPAAEWPDGAQRIVMAPESVEEGTSPESDCDQSTARKILECLIADFEKSDDRNHRREAREIAGILPLLDLPDGYVTARGFLAGFRLATLSASVEIAALRADLAKQESRKALQFHEAAKLAVSIHGKAGAQTLLRLIGCTREERKADVEWRDWLGREVMLSEWTRAANSVMKNME